MSGDAVSGDAVARWMTVLFDLDGTLIEPRTGILGSLRAALREVGVASATDEVLASHIGPPLGVGLAELGVPKERIGDAVAAYRAEFAAIGPAGASVHPGIPELLDDLVGAGIRLAVATSKPRGIAGTVLAQQQLASRFAVIAGADLDERNSSKEAVVGQALASLGKPAPASVVMVGDRSHDVLGARAHGVATVAVTWGFAAPGELASCDPQWQVRSIDELRAVLLAGMA